MDMFKAKLTAHVLAALVDLSNLLIQEALSNYVVLQMPLLQLQLLQHQANADATQLLLTQINITNILKPLKLHGFALFQPAAQQPKMQE